MKSFSAQAFIFCAACLCASRFLPMVTAHEIPEIWDINKGKPIPDRVFALQASYAFRMSTDSRRSPLTFFFTPAANTPHSSEVPGLLDLDVGPEYNSIRAFYGKEYAENAVARGDLIKPPGADDLFERAGSSTMYFDWLWRTMKDADGNYIIPYEFNSAASFPASQRTTIENALQTLSDQVGGYIKFVKKGSSHDAFITVTSEGGCWSYIGQTYYAGQSGGQQLNLQPNDSNGWGCVHAGIVQHEMMHALGFFHEQSRPDRDNHVTINFQNIQSGREGNFEKSTQIDTQGAAYDYGSLMHYGTHAFSANGQPTIVTNGGQSIGQRNGPSSSDVRQLRLLYQCENRIKTVAEYNSAPCSSDCTCSEGMSGCAGSDANCRGDLACEADVCVISSGPPPTTPAPTTPSPPPTTPAPTTAPPTTPSPPPTTPAPTTAPPTTPSPPPTTPAPTTAPPTTPSPPPTTPSPPPTTPSPSGPSCCQTLVSNNNFLYNGNEAVCVSATVTGSCSANVRYAEAKAACEASNSRLCTVNELVAKEAHGIGCNLKRDKVWTSTPCTDGFYIAKGYNGGGTRCKRPERTSHLAKILCCADQC